MYHGIKLSAPAESALSTVQSTVLSPMEEALFQSWSHANGIEKPDDPNNMVDLRGVYKGTQGMILPHGTMPRIVSKANAQSKLEQILSDRLKDKTKQNLDEKANTRDSNNLGDKPHPADVQQSEQERQAQEHANWIAKQSEDAFSGAQSRQADLHKELFKTNRQPTDLEKAMLDPRYPYQVGIGRRNEVSGAQ